MNKHAPIYRLGAITGLSVWLSGCGARSSSEQRSPMSWWLVLLLFGAIILAFIMLGRQEEEETTERYADAREEPPPATASAAEAPLTSAPEAESEPAPEEPDDLKTIEGIGPKISRILQDQGIDTFQRLAQTDAATLRHILDEAGIGKIADPSTWPEQAALAAEGKWDELKALQNELKGGRRVRS
ncbi:MAG: hypothetical protein GXP42_19790 [Chloroflexi bacterium]|nr:hypothetical protein [Chloroflexota bacterium]